MVQTDYIDMAQNMPWLVYTEFLRLIVLPIIKIKFALAKVSWRRNWRIYGIPILQIHRQGKLIIGDGLKLRSTNRSNPLGVNHPVIISVRRKNASIKIGDDFGMTGGSIVAEESINIGDRVLVGANCLIIDSDFHSLDSQNRHLNTANPKPVVIKDDVFIGTGSIILKGSHIGSGSVIGAGSIISGNIPQGVIAVGNPAQVIKQLNH